MKFECIFFAYTIYVSTYKHFTCPTSDSWLKDLFHAVGRSMYELCRLRCSVLIPKFPNADEADRTDDWLPLVLDDGATSNQNSSFPLSLIGPNVQTNPFATCWPGAMYIVFLDEAD